MLGMFTEWWCREISSLVRLSPAAVAPGTGHDLVVEMLHVEDGQSPAVRLIRRPAGGLGIAGDFRLDPAGLDRLARMTAAAKRPLRGLLRPPPGSVLHKELNLPLAAEAELRRVVSYEMDRETPFAADEVYWDAVVAERDRTHGRLHVSLSLVPRVLVDGTIVPLRAAGLEIAAIAAAARGDQAGVIDLPRSEDARKQQRQRWIIRGGVVAAGLVLLVTLPFVVQMLAMARVEARITAIEPQFVEAQARTDGRPHGPVAQELARVGDALAILATVTAAIPDHSYLTDFSLKARRLTLIGHSTAATDLLAAVAGHPGLRNAAFAAPVTREAGSGVESFTISLEAAP